VAGKFDVAIVLETFEYLEPSELESYVFTLSEKLNDDGAIFSTMPNEKGVPLLVKALPTFRGSTKRVHAGTILECIDRTSGPRAIRGRRGFDCEVMAEIIKRYFPCGYLESVEPANAPLWLSLNVGLVKSKVIPQPRASEVRADHRLAGGVRCR